MLSVPTVVPIGTFSAMVVRVSTIDVGASFTLVIVIAKAFSVNNPPASVERTRMLCEICCSKSSGEFVSNRLLTICHLELSLLPVPLTNE